MVIENIFDFGDIVYLITDREQLPRVVTAIEIYKAGEILYKLASGSQTSYHYDFEISPSKITDFV